MLSCGTKGLVHEVSQVIAYLSFDVTYRSKKVPGVIVGGNTPPKKNQFQTLQADLKRQLKTTR